MGPGRPCGQGQGPAGSGEQGTEAGGGSGQPEPQVAATSRREAGLLPRAMTAGRRAVYGSPGSQANPSPRAATRPTPGNGKCGENTYSRSFASADKERRYGREHRCRSGDFLCASDRQTESGVRGQVAARNRGAEPLAGRHRMAEDRIEHAVLAKWPAVRSKISRDEMSDNSDAPSGGSTRREFLARASGAVAASLAGTSLLADSVRSQMQTKAPAAVQSGPARGPKSTARPNIVF